MRNAVPSVLRELIPGYRIDCEIGRSDKAVVYLAHSAAIDQSVALKVANRMNGAHDRQGLFAREYAAMSLLRHPAIVDIHDYGMHDGMEYLAMEYFPRGNLRTRMAAGLTELEALRYLHRIASALGVVHAAGLLHRDLKPPNVMLRETDEIVLIDFGLACETDGAGRSTLTGVLRGSPYYMSPEQAIGEELTPKADLYSLGIILYEMLTGSRPFSGASAIEVLEQHVNARPAPLPAPLRHLQRLLDLLLAKSPDERPDGADQVAEVAAGLVRVRADGFAAMQQTKSIA